MENYGTLANADSYHAARGNTAWAGADAVKLAALVRASAYVDGLGQKPLKGGGYASLFPGVKTGGRAQLLAWPRTGATDQDGSALDAATVPAEVERATYEAALRELVTPGSLSPDYVAADTVKREKVDVIETEYAVGTPDGKTNPLRPVVSVVLELLAPVMIPAGFNIGFTVV